MTANAINYWKLREDQLHNRVMESIQRGNLEVQRGNLEETVRQNKAYTAEVTRHNLATEQLGVISNEIGFRQAAASAAQASAAARQASVAQYRATTDAYVAFQNLEMNAARIDAEIEHTLAHAQLAREQAQTESFKRAQLGTGALASAISTVTTLAKAVLK